MATNYERIKSMSVEEMAGMLCHRTTCDECEGYDICRGPEVGKGNPDNGLIKWLKSEAEI